MNIHDNTILITGGSSGIGLALAKELVKYNNKLILVGRNEDKLEKASVTIGNSVYYKCDLSDDVQLDNLLEVLFHQYPTLNVIINNAGKMMVQNAGNSPDESDFSLFKINYFVPRKIIEILLPKLLTQPRAAVINITTALVDVPLAAAPSYCSSKAALHVYTSTLRWQLRDKSIGVYEVLPPIVSTNMSHQLGLNGMPADEFTRRVVNKLSSGANQIRIGQAFGLHLMSRFFPSFIYHKLNRNKHGAVMG